MFFFPTSDRRARLSYHPSSAFVTVVFWTRLPHSVIYQTRFQLPLSYVIRYSLDSFFHDHHGGFSISATRSIRCKKEELAALKSVLEDAVDEPGRYCHKIFAFSVTFEADNISAARDTHNFQQILQMFGLPKEVELVIEVKDTSPARTMNWMLHSLVSRVQDPEIHCVISVTTPATPA